ncbi:MAG: zinc-binding dehydrogenase [Oscillospiraceae bacterium]
MKAVVLTQRGHLSYLEVPTPKPPLGWALVQVKACAVCATDLELIYSDIVQPDYPLIPGHEWAGVVSAVGSERHSAWVGKRVVGSNDVGCDECEECLSGRTRYCSSFKEIGFLLNGGYAEYMLVPCKNLYELPGGISFIQGALLEPLAVGVGCVEKGGIHLGDTVTVIGMGSIGLNIIAAAKAAGAVKIVAAASSDTRWEYAQKAGADLLVTTTTQNLVAEVRRHHPGGSHVVLDATGNQACIQNAFNATRLGGTVVLAGYGGGKSMALVLDDVHINNLQVMGAGKNWGHVRASLELLESGLTTDYMATDILALPQYQQALEAAEKRPKGFVKSVFVFE